MKYACGAIKDLFIVSDGSQLLKNPAFFAFPHIFKECCTALNTVQQYVLLKSLDYSFLGAKAQFMFLEAHVKIVKRPIGTLLENFRSISFT